MFEREAEEYCIHQRLLEDVRNNICKAFEDGAKFVYNKVNEWHYLKENPNDLPNNREKVLLLVKLHDKFNRTEVMVGHRDFGDCLGEYCKDWGYFEPVKNRFYDFVDGEEVIAWKEIMYPDVKYYCCR